VQWHALVQLYLMRVGEPKAAAAEARLDFLGEAESLDDERFEGS
jgi:hypothetical protein